MLNCPVCATDYAEATSGCCRICGWDLTPYFLETEGQLPPKFREQEQTRLDWAKLMWERLQAAELQHPLPLDHGGIQYRQDLTHRNGGGISQEFRNHQMEGDKHSDSDPKFAVESSAAARQSPLKKQSQNKKKSKGKSSSKKRKQKPLKTKILVQEILERLNNDQHSFNLNPNPQNEWGKTQLDELRHLLYQSANERAYLQSQLEWVLYRLEQLNPEKLGETLSQLEVRLQEFSTAAPLMSEVGMDYHPLMELLAAGQWQLADELTWQMVLQIAFREVEGWLSFEDIANFPCTDLQTLNNLWEYYSHGLFGLKAQQNILESVGNDYTDFCDCVAWREAESWLYYEELKFSLEAPQGHLPVLSWRKRACYGVGNQMAAEIMEQLALRLIACKIQPT